ncbi:reductase [Streptomyces sp. DSM 41982]|uniref:Reductase n=1 Tax=Streptomyces evansiae TaxID=3075535 RepID=A0ABD5DY38_9ACTN|nr:MULTISPECIES: NAD-dependent epimerase/dehydratase family protein [unclassified Streptomyces]MDT0414063.1 reductase [Streptomyces sp. DSM 41982]SCE27517.1 Nucleoside-diphosphate-sugar epimerase [Streptomyces sp. SolWspMP-sol7th]
MTANTSANASATRLLVLGGTEFVGRATVEAGLARGWDVTVLNRGTKPVPEGARALVGDRTAPGGLAALEGGEWDLVVDTWSHGPRAVRDAAEALKERAGRYVYVSTCSVYTWPRAAGTGVGAPLVEGDPDAEARDYPSDKRGGELAVARAFGEERALLARAGLILGPYENVGRLPWWLLRMRRGGEVLAPGPRELPLAYIDARDLAAWLLDAGAAGHAGAFDLVSPSGHTTMGEFLETCRAVTGSDAVLRWAAPEQVEAAGIEPWTELPVWCPPGEMHGAMHTADVTPTLEAGLRCRPVAETVADTWAWVSREGGETMPPRTNPRSALGLDAAKEAETLAGLGAVRG